VATKAAKQQYGRKVQYTVVGLQKTYFQINNDLVVVASRQAAVEAAFALVSGFSKWVTVGWEYSISDGSII